MGIYGKLQELSKAQPTAIESEKNKPEKVVSPIQAPPKANQQQESYQASKPDSKQAIVLSRYQDSIIEAIRKAVKFVGKDAFFGRFTPEEKRMLADAAYTYKRRGLKTSENEIARIAVNFIINDHQENGENSVLEQVLKALNK